ncbi:MAG: hypothetical protein JW797_03300 [Bradymonadales bacterium]|nr:hypothetical protein [Bradymonadales bacterium]
MVNDLAGLPIDGMRDTQEVQSGREVLDQREEDESNRKETKKPPVEE